MKLKLDENLGQRTFELLVAAGHDVATVVGQHLGSASDERVIEACRAEQRCLVTLDLGFGNPLRYKPLDFAGIAVLRLPAKTTANDLRDTVRTLINGLATASIDRRLWIVERRRLRVYQPEDADPFDEM